MAFTAHTSLFGPVKSLVYCPARPPILTDGPTDSYRFAPGEFRSSQRGSTSIGAGNAALISSAVVRARANGLLTMRSKPRPSRPQRSGSEAVLLVGLLWLMRWPFAQRCPAQASSPRSTYLPWHWRKRED